MNLQEAIKQEFSAAKLGWVMIVALQVAGLAVALLALLFPRSMALVAVAAGVALPLACAGLKKYAGDRYSKGEANRRLLLLIDGWDRTFSPSESLMLAADTTALPSWDPPPAGGYYTSPRVPGAARAAHLVEESAFYSVKHATTAATLCWAAVLSGAIVGVTLLWLAANGLFSPAAPQIAQAAGALLAFGATSELAQMALAYGELSAAARRTVEACGPLARQATPDPVEVAYVIGAYDCALAKCPPIPGIIYRHQRGALRSAWQAHGARIAP